MTKLVEIRRVTVVTDVVLEKMLLDEFARLGAKGYTSMDCHGKGRHNVVEGVDPFVTAALVRIELLVQPAVADSIVDYLHREVFSNYACTACVETVEVASSHPF